MLEADVEVDRRDFRVEVALEVAAGQRLALFGPSGAGKTTTLEVIAGLVSPRRGRVALGGRVLDPPPAQLSVTVAGAPCYGPDGRLLPGSAWVGA
ncbi:MAG TPA: ATP-binding cassette domain-containing protein [Streptosporangiaceae bacterium]